MTRFLTGLSPVLLAATSLFASACEQEVQPARDNLYGIELGAFERVPAIDAAFRLEPAVASEGLEVPSSQLIADALRACESEVSAPGALEKPLAFEFDLHEAVLTRAARGAPGGSPTWKCLAGALDGKTFSVPTVATTKLSIQLRRHLELPR